MTASQGVSPARWSRGVTPAPHERTVEARTRKGRQGESADEGCLPDSPLVASVNIAARIAAESTPGEVLVSQTVRDLARTSAGVAFEDRGEKSLKGVSEPVRVWTVQEEDA